MRYRALAGLVLLALLGTMLAGCTDSSGTEAMLKLQEELAEGQSLSEVQASMSDELSARATVYPAKEMKKVASGDWIVTAKDGGTAGDTDAPFQLILVAPKANGASTLAILFDDKTLIESVWWSPTNISILKAQLLGELIPADAMETE